MLLFFQLVTGVLLVVCVLSGFAQLSRHMPGAPLLSFGASLCLGAVFGVLTGL
jgi:hypothetical protein